jgi:hypothetical protein
MTKVFGSVKGTPEFYRFAEIHFPTMEVHDVRGWEGDMAHATAISSGGEPIFWIVQEDETLPFGKAGRVSA